MRPPADSDPATDVVSRMMEDDAAAGVSEAQAAARTRAALFGGSAPPLSLARYRIDARLGRGAMGEVWRAHDPELSRDVAIKLVLPGRADGEDTERLLREARSLARLAHPNVVTVFDVGAARVESDAGSDVAGGSASSRTVYIVMELVEGVTLAEWLAAEPRAWRRIVDVLGQAAAGLVAAHEAGLVHRDFKPSNVFVGTDGRVRVGDFGLARASTVADPSSAEPTTNGAAADLDATTDDRITRTGALIGTPLYMAPEQHRGEAPTPAADQFAFCTVAFEALVGRRPFAGGMTEMMRAKAEGAIDVPRSLACPRDVMDVVLRGLRPDRADRWSTMAELARALRKAAGQNRGVARWLIGGTLALGIVGAAFIPAEPDACPMTAVGWTLPMRISVAETLASELETPQVEATLARLDARAQVLDAMSADACRRAEIDRGCVRLASTQFATTVVQLAKGDRTLARHAATIVELLPDPALCSSDGTRPTASAQLPTWDAIAKVRVLGDAGRGTDALDAADLAMREVEALGDTAARARALLAYERAVTLEDVGEHALALAAYEAAYFLAVEIDDALTAARAAADLMAIHGRNARPEAETWRRHLATWAPRVHASPAERARLELDVAIGLAHTGERGAAIEGFRRAIAACEEACPELDRIARDGIAEVMVADDRFDDAIALRRALLGEVEADVGVGSRAAARAKIGLAAALLPSSPREALAMVDAAIPVLSSGDTASMSLSEAHLIAAQSHAALGDGAKSLASARRAMELFEPRAKIGDQSVAAYRATLASALEVAGDIAAARREYDAIVAGEPDDVVMVAQVLVARSFNRVLSGDHDGAIADARLARASLGLQAAQRHDLVLASLSNEAWASFAKGECDAGLVALDTGARRSGEIGDTERRASFELDAVGGLLDCGRVDAARTLLSGMPAPSEGSRRSAWITYYRARLEPQAVGATALAAARQIALRAADRILVERLDDLAGSPKR